MKQNYRPSLARNVGIAHSQGEIVCFLDDDALAHHDYVAEHLAACRDQDSLGVRGRILPKTYSSYNRLAFHYDLGLSVVPSYVDMENNASFPRRVLLEVGGFNPRVFAGEGVELSYRIVRRFGERSRLLYWPGAVVFHDYSNSLQKLLRKTLRGAKMRVLLEREYPDFWNFVESYHPLPFGGVPPPSSFLDRAKVAAVRRVVRLLGRAELRWYRWRLRAQ